ncbi:heavy-metal-associated domain-containing protein [Clostridium sp.]|uniref:heavy-metal-associated domain-containing protein n=1 Tax=Clostridium sp. TaxID=1506 RepID=UPI003F3E5FD9
MKSIIMIPNLLNSEDVKSVREAIANSEGVVACEVNLAKKEVSIVFDEKSTSADEIASSIEAIGYSVA